MNRSFHALWVLLAITAGLVPALGLGGRAVMPLGTMRLERASGCSAAVLPDWRYTALTLTLDDTEENYADTCGLDRTTGEVYSPGAEAGESCEERMNLEEELDFQAWLDWYEAESQEPVAAEPAEEFEAYDRAYHSEHEECPRGSHCPRSVRKHVDAESLFSASIERQDDEQLASDWDCGLFVAPADRTAKRENVPFTFDLEASIDWTRTLLQLAERELLGGAFAYDQAPLAEQEMLETTSPLGEAAYFEIPTVELTLALGERPLPNWLTEYSWDAIARRDALLAEQREETARKAIENAYAAAESAAAESEALAEGYAIDRLGPNLPPSPEPNRVAYLGEYEGNFIPPLETAPSDDSDWLEEAFREENRRPAMEQDPAWLYRMFRGIREIYRNIDQTLPVVPSPEKVDELLGDLRLEALRIQRARLHGEHSVPLAIFVPDEAATFPAPVTNLVTASDLFPEHAHEAYMLLESGFAVESTIRAARKEASVRLQLLGGWCRTLADAIDQEASAPHAAVRRSAGETAR